MKAFKKIAAFFAATLMTASMAVSISASAGNTSDTPWEAGNEYTRPKYDATSIYVQNVSMIYSTKVSVYGRKSSNGDNLPVNTYNGRTLATIGLTLPPNSQRLIRQFINEKGYSYAHISFYNGNTACGQWSPDSVGSYPTIN